MKRITLDQLEKKYVMEPLERFDETNTMFNRWSWDPEMRSSIKDWRFLGEVTERPGYSLRDLALRRSARVGTGVSLTSLTKPNPGRFAIAMNEAMKEVRKATALPGQTPSMDAADLATPEWAKEAYAKDPKSAARDIKKVSKYFGADLVGICKLDHRLVYSHTYHGEGPSGAPGDTPIVVGETIPQEIPDDYKHVIVMAFSEDYNMIKHYPTWIAHSATSMGYSIMAITNMFLSAFIRSLGFKAIESSNDIALSTPMGMQAGLGDLGRNGLLITPEFGPRIRLSKVITNLPLAVDDPIDFGVTEFCSVCKKCAKLCPSQSLSYGERTIEPINISNSRGILKWPINAETCRKNWGQMNKPCTTCISSCPYNKPDTMFHRTVRWFTDYARWADSLYVKLDDMFGYGKPEKVDNFWDDWQPIKL